MNFVLMNLIFSIQAVAAALLMNIYIVGLNQLYDIDIDKVALSSYCLTFS